MALMASFFPLAGGQVASLPHKTGRVERVGGRDPDRAHGGWGILGVLESEERTESKQLLPRRIPVKCSSNFAKEDSEYGADP